MTQIAALLYEEHMLKLEALINDGKEETKEAYDLLDQLDVFWYQMNEKEQTQARKFVADM